MARPFDALTEEEKKELRMEGIDIFFFWINIMISIGMDAEMITNYYFSKRKENENRQKKVGGY